MPRLFVLAVQSYALAAGRIIDTGRVVVNIEKHTFWPVFIGDWVVF